MSNVSTYVGAAALGIVAVAAAPFTAGSSLALLFGTAGVMTAAGVAVGATGGVVTVAVVDLCSSGEGDGTEALREEAARNKAGWVEPKPDGPPPLRNTPPN